MLIDGLVNHLVGTPKDDLQRDISDALSRYYTYRTINDSMDYLIGGGRGRDNLQDQNLQLEILMKKRELGLPDDTREFNQEINDPLNRPSNRILAGLGIRGSNTLQSMAAAPKTAMQSASLPFFPGGPEGVANVSDLGHGGLSLFGILRRANRPAAAIRRATRFP